MNDDYTPIACATYDDLGLRMLRGTPTTLVVRDAGGTERMITARIDDIYTDGPAEYVRLDSGAIIRLDRIVDFADAASEVE